MCDQTEVLYTSGDVVWVKLGPVWWPGQVQDYDSLPEEITSNLRKKPIAVVKFFQEDSFEYVKNLDHIYHYNCRKKEEFIKKGLDMVRSSNSREVPSNMKMFPEDIVMAEHITGGDPSILNNTTFAPEQKSDYSDLFGTKKSSGKKIKSELKKERNSWKPRKLSNAPLKHIRRSLPVLPSTIRRPITHPRFLTKALEGKSDHEIRIRCQSSVRRDYEEKSPIKNYNCHLCEFHTTRLNVIVLHNKSHSASFIEAQNSIRAQLKSREKDSSPSISSLNDQTPKTVTSRGRVKSLPKKLMDYTDEPPAKVFREKTYNKHTKTEENLESPSKSTPPKSPSKSAKKIKDDSDKTPIKRPLFGKRKTAKEKAELAAKQKEENKVMKETLLKDWDDDDLFQEEVELEQLKQALESTASTIECEYSNSSEADDAVHIKSLEGTATEDKVKSDNSSSKTVTNSDIKAKVFEFDDSEDSLPVTNFRLKNQREKFTDDKFKKPKPPKPKIVSKSKSSILSPFPSLRQESDKETEEFNKAFNSLLEETSVPVLPEIPKTSLSVCISSDLISEQTSDISSSTDLVKGFSIAEIADDKINDEELKQRSDSEYISSALNKLECTSSDSEEQVSEPVMESHNTEELELAEQKNLNKVSASNPRVEIDSDLLISGVATTTSDNYKPSNIVPSGNETLILREDLSTTEITSTCEIAKSYNEEAETKAMDGDEISLKMECKEEANSPININNLDDGCLHIDNTNINLEEDTMTEKLTSKHDEKVNEPEILKNIGQVQETGTHPTSERNRVKIEGKTIEAGYISNDNTNFVEHEDFQALSISNESIYQSSQTITTPNSGIITNAIQLERAEESIPISSFKKETSDLDAIKQTSIETGECKALGLTPSTIQSAPAENVLNVQLIMPGDTISCSNALNINSQQLGSTDVKIEMAHTGKAENQNLSQNLQDMELDINSMPVIIGGEDFVEPEQSKQSLVSIQPKYSDSIVITPKVTQSPNKSEGVIMHLGDPSTSSQHLQPLMALPSKSVKNGSRGRSQKSTSKTIKLPAGTLKNLGSLQKGGNQQVLILKTASSGQDKSDKSTIQKPCSMFQHGNKILIVNNAQISGQNKIKLNPQQQQLLTGGKLAPGTRVITSKVVATTSSQGTESPSKMSFSKSPSKTTQKLVISKGGLLTNAPNSVIINRKLSNVQGTITTSKGQTLITHNLLNTKGGLILPSSPQNTTSSAKTTAIITSQALTTNKSMFISPITSKGGTIISGNQKLRIVSSKAPLGGTRLLVQNSQGKLKVDPQHKGQQVKLISGLRGQSSGNTILIHTSQGLIAKSISSSTVTTAATQPSIRATQIGKTVITTIPTQAKIRASPAQQSQIVQQPITVQSSPARKATVQKVKQNPNIIQKSQRKSTPRASKSTGNRLISPAVSLPEPIILSPATSLPSVGPPSLVQGPLPQTSDGLLYLTVDETGNYRQIDNKSMISFEGNPETPRTIFIPADSQTQDMSNIFLAIDDAGNIVNITQPSTNKTLTTENTEPTQDILAKALANTQVLQQETIIPDMDVSAALASSSIDTTILTSNSYSEQANYPAPSLSHSVLETSLTLNQPIMTPLEVPSAVSPNIGQMSTISSNFLSSNLITKQKHVRPSMPLLTEESMANQTGNEPVYLLDSSNNIIPATSGSNISFQLTLDDNKVIMAGTESAAIPSTYQVVTGDLLATHIVDPRAVNAAQKLESIKTETLQIPDENITYNILSQGGQDQSETQETVKQSIILREALEGSQASVKTNQFLTSVEEMSQDHDELNNFNSSQEDILQQGNVENPSLSEHHAEQLKDSFTSQDEIPKQAEEEMHSLKRNFGEEQTVTSSSDLKNESKRMRINER